MRQVRFVLMGFCLLSGLLWAAAGDKHTFELKWKEHGISDRVEVPLDRDEPFAKEPNFGQRKVWRGVLGVGAPGHREQMGFAWDKSEGKLYMDLNRDGDLTNDPNGVLETDDARGGDYQNHNFSAFPVSFSNELGVFRYQLSANMFDYPWSRNAEFVIRSSYLGTVDLEGVGWFFEVNDKLAAAIQQDNKLSVHIDEGDSTNFISSLAVPESIFLDGRCYDVDFEFRKGENAYSALWCTLTEKEVPLGRLRIEGGLVNQLVFGNRGMLILPPLTGEPVSVPVGDYRLKACSLKYEQNRPGVSPPC